MRLCLDTSAYSHFKRGDPAPAEELRTASRVGVPVIVLGELRAGFRQGSRARQNERDLRKFLSQAVVEVLDVDDEASSHFADLVTDLRRRGTPLPTNDVWIAAVALREGMTVLTYGAHFEALPQISVRRLDRAG